MVYTFETIGLLILLLLNSIRLYDPESGEELEEIHPHEKKINRVSFNRNKTMFITSRYVTIYMALYNGASRAGTHLNFIQL